MSSPGTAFSVRASIGTQYAAGMGPWAKRDDTIVHEEYSYNAADPLGA